MKKKILSRILLSSTLALPLFAVAASCSVKQKSKYEILKKQLNDAGSKITLDYLDKQNISPDMADAKNVQYNNFDKSKYDIKFKKISTNLAENTVTITFYVKDKNSDTTSKEINKTIEGFKVSDNKTDKLNRIANMVTLNYPDKENVFSEDVDLNKVESFGYDKLKYEINIIRSFPKDEDDTKAEVTFSIEEKETGEVSDETKKIIDGFKAPVLVNENLNIIANGVFLEYPNKENVFAKEAKLDNVKTSNYDKETYEVSLKSVASNDDKKSVTVVLSVKNIKTQKTSDEIKKIIDGFKAEMVATDDLNIIAKGVNLEYPNKENVFVKDAVANDIRTSNYDANSYEVIVKSVTPDVSKKSVTVTFSVKNKKTQSTSKDTSKQINGFKNEIVVTENLDNVVDAVTLNYPEKETILANDALITKVDFLGYDKSKYEVITKNFIKDNSKKSVTVIFSVRNKKTLSTSKDVEKHITGFKSEMIVIEDLNAIANEIILEYPNRISIFAKDATSNNVRTLNYSTDLYEVLIKNIAPNDSLGSISVTFSVKSKKTQSTSKDVTKQLTGFKVETVADLNELANKVTLNYPGKENIFAKDVTSNKVQTSNFNEKEYEVSVKSVTPDVSKKSVTVTFSVKNKKTQLSSQDVTKQITGFKAEVVVENLDNIANAVNLNYLGKEKILASEAKSDKVQFSGYDNAKYEVITKTLISDNSKKIVTVTFSVKNKTTQSTSKDVTKQITGFRTELVADLNAVANKVNLEYPGKNKILAKDVVKNQIQTSNFDTNQYEVTIKNVVPDISKKLVTVTFSVKNKKSQLSSNDVTKQITGFKAETDADLNVVANKVVLEYPGKEKITAKNVVNNKIQTSNFDANEYEVVVESVTPDVLKKLVTVTFSVKNKKTQLSSDDVSKQITGFKAETIADLDAIANKVNADYPGKENTFAKDVTANKVQTSNFDQKEYEVTVKNVTPDKTRKYVTVTFSIQNKNTKLSSHDVTKQITGFKPETSVDLNDVAKKVKAEYPGKENTFAKDVTNSKVQISSFDENEYEVAVKNVTPDKTRTSVTVTFTVKNKHTKTSSDDVTKQITGFKPETTTDLNTVANNVHLEYLEKENTFAKDAAINKVKTSNFDVSEYEVTIKRVTPDNSRRSVNVTYALKNKHTQSSSNDVTKLITGFKAETTSDLNTIANKVNADYPGKENTFAKDVTIDKVKTSIFDENEYEVEVKNVTPDKTRTSVTVTFTVKNKHTKTSSDDVTKRITGFKPETAADLNAIANKVNLEYLGKENTLAKDATSNKIQTSNFDVNEYEVTIKSVTPDNSRRSVTVTYSLKNKHTQSSSNNVTKQITGFKVETTADLNTIANKVNAEYPGKENTFAKDVAIDKVKTSSFDKNEYEVEVKNVTPDKARKSVTVTFSVKNKHTNTSSGDVTKQITGFKSETTTDLNAIANKVNLEYSGKENTLANDAVSNKIQSSNFDVKEYEVIINRITPDTSRTSVTVTFTVKNKHTQSSSNFVTKQIFGFKTPVVVAVNLDEIANKVVVDYKNKASVFVSDATNQGFTFSGFDTNKFNISITTVTKNIDGRSAVVGFKVSEKNNSNRLSAEKQKTVSEFRKSTLTVADLLKIAKSIKIDYTDKRVYPWGANPKYISSERVPANVLISNLSITGVTKNNDAVVTFTLSDKHNSLTKIKHSVEVKGLVSISRNESYVTQAIFNDNKGYINLEDKPEKRFSLYKELTKESPELTINFSSNKILVPANGSVVNLGDPNTYTEVGSLTNTYYKVHNKLLSATTKLINDNFKKQRVDLNGLLNQLLTSSKDQAGRLLNSYRSTLSKLSGATIGSIEFDRNFYTNLEKLVKNDNYSIVYRPKTGILAMKIGSDEIDMNKVETLTTLFTIKYDLKNRITSSIIEVLKKEKANTIKVDQILKDQYFKVGYIIQKKGNRVIKGLKIKQNLKPKNS